MGLIRGSGSLTRYFVNGSIVDKDLKEIEKRIRRNSFKKLDEIGSEERSTGWVNIMYYLKLRISPEWDEKELPLIKE